MFQEITIQFTERCNLRCSYCFAPHSNNELSPEAFRIFEEFCIKNRPDDIHITGGEPALAKRFGEYVSRLEKISSLVIYSNFTVKNMMNGILADNPYNIVFLVNTNGRYFCSEDEKKNIKNNIEQALAKGFRIALSHTFYSDSDEVEKEFDYLIGQLNKYDIRQLRISQALACIDESKGLERKDIKNLYHYVAENVAFWKAQGHDVYFDCPVPACYIDDTDFRILRDNKALQIKCLPKVYVMWNLDVTHCYSTMQEENKRQLSSFDNIDLARDYSRNILREKQKKSNRAGCNLCSYGEDGIPCGCPVYCEG